MMATEKQIEANRQNAQASTGPKTHEGKAAISQNAVKLGVYALCPVIKGLELPAEWEEFRLGIVQDLAPVGAFEHALAERVAGCLWRLRRVTSAEAAKLEGDDEGGRQSRAIPAHEAATMIARYESHLGKQMTQALHELQRLQAARVGTAVMAPQMLDVNIHGVETLPNDDFAKQSQFSE